MIPPKLPPKWKGGQCIILLLNKSTRDLLAMHYLAIKKIFGCTDDELKCIRADSASDTELLGHCQAWNPEAVLIEPDKNGHMLIDRTIEAGYSLVAFNLNDRLMRADVSGRPTEEEFTPQELATVSAKTGPGPLPVGFTCPTCLDHPEVPHQHGTVTASSPQPADDQLEPVSASKVGHRYGNPGPMGLDADDHGRNDL